MGNRLEGKLALVTGASRGIGKEVALGYASEGAHVITLARTTGALEELDDEINAIGGSSTIVPMDLSDFNAIDSLGSSIYKRWGKLDILVSNAGILGQISPVEHIPIEVWDRFISINITANWRLLRSLDVLLRQSDNGRAIFTTSNISRNSKPFWSSFALSKAALEALVKTYALELSVTNVKANLIDPGNVATALRAEAMPGEDQSLLRQPAELKEDFISLALPDCVYNGAVYDCRLGKFLS